MSLIWSGLICWILNDLPNVYLTITVANQLCTSPNECSHGCALVNGREECFCPLGYELSENRTWCIGEKISRHISYILSLKCCFNLVSDRDECLGLPCDQVCTNIEGSFHCSCMSGFEQQSDSRRCEGTLYYNCISILYHHIILNIM